MADAALEFLLEKLCNLLLDEKPKLYMKTEVEELERELRLMKVFLKDSTAKQRRVDPVVKELVRQATDVIYEADDVIDSILTYKASRSKFRIFLRSRLMVYKFSGPLSGVTAMVRSFLSFSDKARMDFASVSVDEEHDKQNLKEPGVRRDNIVGFEEEMDTLIGYLGEETEQLDVSTIVGMPGIGKTTLAWKIYACPKIENEFPIRIWIHVSNNFTDKDILVAILRKFTRDDVIGQNSVEELAELVRPYLERERFLIVMDDVRSVNDLSRLQNFLPKSNKLSKVLITTCNEAVGRHASRSRPPCKVRFLNDSESWSLLQFEVFGKHDVCPQELENVGKLIAKQCKGLPLAVVVMGGIVAQKDNPSSDMAERKAVWIKACQDIPVYLNDKFYDDLPQHLQVCFLYFGMFPSDFEISVWNLVRMWVAEGFILKQEGLSLEEIGESYLEDLINKHLVVVGKYSGDGKLKTCSIHQMLHDFCKIKARKENVLEEIKFTHGVFEPPISQLSHYRRLCIHSNVPDFLYSQPSCPRARSFVSFSSDEINLPLKNNSAIPAAFQLLRLLDIKPIILSKLPGDLFQLNYLRYLALSLSLHYLPSGFYKLWSMQTLIVDTTCSNLEIMDDIWELANLRHFKTNASADLPRSSNTTRQEAQDLQTLGMVSPQSCTEENLDKARNLKKLGIRGRLSPFFDGKEGSFDCVGKLAYLEKLKLLNDVFSVPPSEGRVHSLPPAYKFPPKLRSLTLYDTQLDWSQMLVLASLDRLEVLKLKKKAFVGHTWVTDDRGFHNLEALHIGRTDLVIWVASAYQFPKLKHLELYNCEKLQEVPIELADIPSLQRLELFQTKLAAASANRIHERKQKYIQGRSNKDRAFKLSVFPQN